jgi:pimeloyl-ACP methyl ester carboxylesterase
MRSFAHDRLVFEIKDEGPEDGIPVVLLHGFPQDSTAWDAIVGPLHAAGYRTLAPNQRGYSPAARPEKKKAYSWSALAGDVIALLDAAGVDKAHIVGHDWGGSVAWCVASEYPERVRTVAVLSTPHPGALAKVALRSTQLLNSWYMGLFQVPWASEQLLHPGGPLWKAMMKGLPAHQAQHYTERMEQPGALTAALNWYRVLPRELVRPSLKVRKIRVPSLYIWGDRDPALGRAAATATEEFVEDDYTFVILREIGHWIPETAPDRVVESLLEFWSWEPRNARGGAAE